MRPIYDRTAVERVGLIGDPPPHTLEVRPRSGSVWALRGSRRPGARVRAEPVDPVEMEARAVWVDVVRPKAPPNGSPPAFARA